MKRSFWPTFAMMGALLATGVNARADSSHRPGETPTVSSAQSDPAGSPTFQFQEPAPVVEGEAVRKNKTPAGGVPESKIPVTKPRADGPVAIPTAVPSSSPAAAQARHDQPQAAPATRDLPMEPVQASPQLLEASRQVSSAGLEIANLGKSMMSARPKKDGQQAGDENLPALSNYYGHQDIGSASGLATVYTDIDFDGLGIRFGLDGERISAKTGLFIYANGGASFLGGNYRADYVQVNQFGAGTNIAVSREDYRVTTLLEAELGVGWQSPKGHIRVTAGYMAMGWHNVLLANAYLNEVTTRLPAETDDFLTFDGLVSGIELRY